MRTLAARKAFDEPLDISIRRAEENRFHPYTRESSSTTSEDEVEGPINLEMPKEPTPPIAPSTSGAGPPTQGQGVYNNGELTIVRRAPSPPQSEPMDFSTKKKQPSTDTEIIRKPNLMSMSYTSTKELRFAKNLKILLVEIMRKHPVKAKVILNYLRFAWTKSKKNANLLAITQQEVKVTSQVTATTTGGQPQTFVQVSDGQGGNSSSTGSGSNQGSGGSSGGSGSGGGGASSGGNDDFF